MPLRALWLPQVSWSFIVFYPRSKAKVADFSCVQLVGEHGLWLRFD